MQRFLGSYMHAYPETILKISHEARVVEEVAAGFPLHQKVEVACLGIVAAGDGAENAKIAGSTALSQGQEVVALRSEGRHGEHLDRS